MCTLVAVDRLRKTVALLLLALWVPVTAHCKLETLSGLDFLACVEHEDSVPHQDSDCQEDVCASVESGNYRMEDNPPQILLPLAILVPAIIDQPAENSLPPQPTFSAVSFAPPELSKGWQFFFRTALLPRAPSFVS
jgi:hypothetical protein